jgi:hypothetical protein
LWLEAAEVAVHKLAEAAVLVVSVLVPAFL